MKAFALVALVVIVILVTFFVIHAVALVFPQLGVRGSALILLAIEIPLFYKMFKALPKASDEDNS